MQRIIEARFALHFLKIKFEVKGLTCCTHCYWVLIYSLIKF